MSDLPHFEDVMEVYEIRKQKLSHLRTQGFMFPNTFTKTDDAHTLKDKTASWSKEALEAANMHVSLAGRVVLRRLMGKASFFHLQDHSGRIQIYLRSNDLPEVYEQWKHDCDLGDIVGVKGVLFYTQTGELTVHATSFELLTKSLRPLPDKFHGLTDQETRYRKRYVDLIANEQTRHTFLIRSRLIQSMRRFMEAHAFLEVETPMMHSIPGGALARPFVTHHHALDQSMYLRIAPELYLKRLIVGGFERVYEINRNFRNEGLSTRHNPEFTMMEFYQAYADYQQLMDFTEQLIHHICDEIFKTRTFVYQGVSFDLNQPFARMTMQEAILHYEPYISSEALASLAGCHALLDHYQLTCLDRETLGQCHLVLFESLVEHRLIQPTFITSYPTEVSPLARRNVDDPSITDRFEFFMGGREIANGFSELNDPEDQAARFHAQVLAKDAGDLEAMHFDHDYIEALEYGMPPTAGEGIGIDRLVMFFTDMPSIRDVILFPHLRREVGSKTPS